MQEDEHDIVDAEFEVVKPQADRRLPFWERYEITMVPGWWILVLSSGIIAVVSNLNR